MKIEVIITFVIVMTIIPVGAGQALYNLDKKISVCEGSSLSYKFKLSEDAGNDFSYEIYPKDNFFIRQTENEGELEIFSRVLNKSDSNKIYEEKIVILNNGLVQEKIFNISVIETNEPPKVEDFGVRTLEIFDNRTLHEKIIALDVEDGALDAGILKSELIFSSGRRFFEIKNGTIDIAPQRENAGNYEVLICTIDSGIKSNEESVRVCGKNSVASKKTCGIFYLAITEKNRMPEFIEKSPNKTRLDVFGLEKLTFNITVSDADGTKPEIYWYVDNLLKKNKFGLLEDSFEYRFGCEIFGEHFIKARISDGLVNNSYIWSFNVQKGDCSKTEEQTETCDEKWGCKNWDLCQSLEQSFNVGIISEEDYFLIKKSCADSGWKDEACGFQIRNCFDMNSCNNTQEKPRAIQECHFIENPSCDDSIKNCHDGSCEFLVDCSGPCKPCATCSDGIQNQGEEGVDCGGPCQKKCVKEKVKFQINMNYVKYFVLVVIFGLLVLAIIRLVQVYRIQTDLARIVRRRRAKDEIW